MSHFQSQVNSWFQTFTVSWRLYGFFWVIPQSLNFICQRFGTVCSIFIGRWVLPMKMGQCVPKRRHIKFRRRGITQKKAYNRWNLLQYSLCAVLVKYRILLHPTLRRAIQTPETKKFVFNLHYLKIRNVEINA